MASTGIEAAVAAEFAAFAGTGGLFAKHLGTGEVVQFNADAEIPTASTIKVPILIELFRQVEAGIVDLDRRLPAGEAARVGGSGVLRDLSVGLELPIRDHATLMIVVSDNIATNVLIDLVGVDAVNRTMREFGFPGTRLVQRLDFGKIDGVARRLGVTTPADLAGIMAALAEGRILADASRAAILGIMRRTHHRTLVPRYLPFDHYADDPDDPATVLRIANKTGGWTGAPSDPGVAGQRGMRADMALVEWPGARYVVGVAIEDDPDDRFWPENAGEQVIGRVSRLVFDHFGGAALG